MLTKIPAPTKKRAKNGLNLVPSSYDKSALITSLISNKNMIDKSTPTGISTHLIIFEVCLWTSESFIPIHPFYLLRRSSPSHQHLALKANSCISCPAFKTAFFYNPWKFRQTFSFASELSSRAIGLIHSNPSPANLNGLISLRAVFAKQSGSNR